MPSGFLDGPQVIDAGNRTLARGVITPPFGNHLRVLNKKYHTFDSNRSEDPRVNSRQPVISFDHRMAVENHQASIRAGLDPKASNKEFLVLIDINKSQLILLNCSISGGMAAFLY